MSLWCGKAISVHLSLNKCDSLGREILAWYLMLKLLLYHLAPSEPTSKVSTLGKHVKVNNGSGNYSQLSMYGSQAKNSLHF